MGLFAIGERKSVVVAAFIVSATMLLSMFPTNAGVVAKAEAESIESTDCHGETENETCGEIIMLEDFTGPKHKWMEMNDPVMGGKSTGTFTVDETNHVGVFHGSVEIVSFLNAPGFIKAETTKGESWPDASSCKGLQLTLKSSTPSYEGFRVSFGSKRPPDAFPYTYGFKTNMALDASNTGFQTVQLPFNEFTDKWDAGTGDAVVTCAEDKQYCPDETSKKDLFSIAVWGEGVKGEVNLQIQSVAAYGCNAGSGIVGGSDEADELDEKPVVDATAEDVSAGSDTITIEDFSNPNHEWKTLNDPVMGGKSKSSLSIGNGMATFEGICAIVPFLHAPGFITMVTGSQYSSGGGYLKRLFRGHSSSNSALFPDVSGCTGLALSLRTSEDYKGYYVSFGTDRAPGGRYARGYKTHLDLTPSDDFANFEIPFSEFSSKWDDATGKTTVSCQEDPRFCPSVDNLRDMKTISFWGEGVEGNVALDVRSIGAYGCASGSTSATSLASANLSSNLTRSSAPTANLLVGAVLSAVFALGLIAARRRLRKRSPEYQELDVAGAELA